MAAQSAFLPKQPKRTIAGSLKNALTKAQRILQSRKNTGLPYPHVQLDFWVPEAAYKAVNFGDELSYVIVNQMLARRNATLRDGVPTHRQLLAVGSVLHMANDNAVIWGTGLHGQIPLEMHRYRSLDIRAVRGPITGKFLRERGFRVPEVYGDPGILVQKLLGGRFQAPKEFEYGFVPNLHDLPSVQKHLLDSELSNVRMISPLRPWNMVLDELQKCEFILASSLHGLVIADAFGIPSRYVRLSETEGLLKYEDYYEGTGRRLVYSSSISAALDAGPTARFSEETSQLEAAFPYDLWEL